MNFLLTIPLHCILKKRGKDDQNIRQKAFLSSCFCDRRTQTKVMIKTSVHQIWQLVGLLLQSTQFSEIVTKNWLYLFFVLGKWTFWAHFCNYFGKCKTNNKSSKWIEIIFLFSHLEKMTPLTATGNFSCHPKFKQDWRKKQKVASK